MKQPSDPPPGLIPVPLGKQCLLLLTEREYLACLQRGKWWLRVTAIARREGKAPAPETAAPPASKFTP